MVMDAVVLSVMVANLSILTGTHGWAGNQAIHLQAEPLGEYAPGFVRVVQESRQGRLHGWGG
jgi:hypothetical protein